MSKRTRGTRAPQASALENSRAPVRLYTSANNEACDLARAELAGRGIDFREIDVTEDYVLRGWLRWASGERTLPQLFVNDEAIGGDVALAIARMNGGAR